MSSPKKHLCLFANITVSPEKVSDFLKELRPVWQACAKEPECLFFDVFMDPARPGRFRFVEVWTEGREWFETVCISLAGYKGGRRVWW